MPGLVDNEGQEDAEACPECGGDNIVKYPYNGIEGSVFHKLFKDRYACHSCGHEWQKGE